jgi:ABC-type transport system involved in multi-copper enzyme maturation permease subunit
MLTTIITKEIRALIGTTKFAVTFGVVAVLILLSFYVGAANYRLAVAQHEAAQAENLRQMEGLTDWFSLEHHRIFLPPQPLASLVTGISNDIGRTTEVKNRGELIAEDSRFNEDPIYAVFRFLDLTFVFQIGLSLFAILLGYDTVCGEKENGTLGLVFANAIPRATFILGKLIGSFVALALSLTVAIGLGALLLPALGVYLNAAEWMRFGLIALTGLLYFGAFLTLSVFVSALSRRTSSAFLMLLVIWIGAVLVVPRVSVLLAGRAVAVPTVEELAARKATLARQLWKEFRVGMKNFKAPDSGNEHGDMEMQVMMSALNQYMDSLTQLRDGQMDKFAGQLNEERANRQRVQERYALGFARISPAALLALATADLAGTSLDLKNDFQASATAYRETFNAFLKEKTGMNVGGRMIMFKMSDEEEEPPEPIDGREIPAFEFQAATLGGALQSALPDMALLALLNLVFFAGAIVSFLRYDLR